jgi:chemotaxis protein MotB
MSATKAAPTIIIRPRKAQHQAHHGGAWKVAYADFITALMAFFLVMWIVGQDQSVRTAVASYFRDPSLFEYQKAAGIMPGNSGLHPNGASLSRASALSADSAALQRTATQILKSLGKMPEFESIKDRVEITMTDDGLRIELQESAQACLFDTGSARMAESAERVFKAIALELGKLPNDVLVEGHTDSRQYLDQEGYTNWELSADRANAVRRVMEQNGLRQAQVREVRGCADTQLRKPDSPFDARNRRVSILVKHLV